MTKQVETKQIDQIGKFRRVDKIRIFRLAVRKLSQFSGMTIEDAAKVIKPAMK